VEARPESENRADARGVGRKLGRTQGVLGIKHRKAEDDRSNNILALERRFPRDDERKLEIDPR